MTEQEKQVIAFLMQAKNIQWETEHIKDLINQSRVLSETYGGIQTSEKVQTSPSLEANFTKWFEKKFEAERRMLEVMAERQEVLADIIEVIHTLEDSDQIKVLTLRYVDRLRYWQVAKKAHMSKSKMYEVHNKAISILAKNVEKFGKNF